MSSRGSGAWLYARAVPLAAELEPPSFDHTDASLRGTGYRQAMAELRGLDGEPELGTPSGIYGLEKLPLKLVLEPED